MTKSHTWVTVHLRGLFATTSMLYLDLTSLTVAVGVGVTPPMLLEDGTVEAKDVETAVVVGVLLVLRLLRLVGPDSKSILLFLLSGLPSLFTLTMSPPL